MRRFFSRIAAPVTLALIAVTCRDSTAPNALRRARIALVPQYSPDAQQVRAELVAFGISIDNVHLVITRPENVVVKDTVVSFPAAATEITIGVDVDLLAPEETLTAQVELRQGATAYFGGAQTVVARQGSTTPASEPVTLSYVGPGKNARFLVISPKSATITASGTQQYTTAAFTSTEQAVSDLPLAFTSSDPTIATINSSGLAQGAGKAGVVTIVAHGLNGLADSAALTVVPQPARLVWVTQPSANAQAGVQLGTQPVVQLADAGGQPVALAGVTITAAVQPSGLSLTGGTTAVTDANGVAAFTNLAIAGAAQSATLTFSAPQLPPLSATISLGAGPVSQLIKVSGDNQSGTVGDLLANPMLVRAADQFGNPVAGQVVVWQVTAGGSGLFPYPPQDVGSTKSLRETTGADGTSGAQAGLDTVAGVVHVSATLSGTQIAPVTFVATALPGAAAKLVILQQPPATVQAAKVFSPQPSLRLVDQFGNGVPTAGVPVTVTVQSPAGAAAGGSISGTTTVTTQSNGVASFSGLALNLRVAAGYQLVFSSPNIPNATSNPIQVTPGDPVSIARYAWTDSQTVFQGVTPQVFVSDAAGNGVPGVKITWAPLSGNVGTLDSSATQSANAVTCTNSAGYANAGTWNPPFALNGSYYTITASGARVDGSALSGSPLSFTVFTYVIGLRVAPGRAVIVAVLQRDVLGSKRAFTGS